MRTILLLATHLFALPVFAAAQDPQGFEGLDLSDEPKSAEPPKTAPASGSSPSPTIEASPAPAGEKASALKLTEADIVREDRVKAVNRKVPLNRGRLELTPLVFVTLNDAFFPQIGPGLRASYHLADSLALGLRYQQFNLLPEDNVRLAKRQLQSRLPSVLPKHSFGIDVLWSPIYGKLAVLNSIRRFDLYVLGGAGLLLSQTSGGTAPTGGDGPHLTTSLGLGQRFGFLDWLSIDLSLVETFYSDRPQGLNKSILQHALTLNLGFSLFLPTTYEYKEP